MSDSEIKHVTVVYFAALREQRGLDEETVSTGTDTVLDLYRHLHSTHKLEYEYESLRVAVNDLLTEWDHPICEGDRITFLPPIAGG